VPTPLAGAYVLRRERVHILEIPFTQAVRLHLSLGRGVETSRGRDADDGSAPG